MFKHWNRFVLKAVSIGVAGTMSLATPVMASTGAAGISRVIAGEERAVEETAQENQFIAVSGIAGVKKTSEGMLNARKVLSENKYEKTEEEKKETRELADQVDQKAKEEKSVSPYENIAIAQTISNVNIRSSAGEDGKVVGKIYNNAAAKILDVVEKEDGRWYKIQSGAVEGYTKADYFVTGKEAEAKAYEVGDVKATVSAETLRLRSAADTESSVITLLSEDEKYDVISQENGFAKIRIDDDVVGYVSSDYVNLSVDFEKAMTIEEVREAIEAQERAEREAAEEAERKAREAREAEEAAREEEPEYDDEDEDEDVEEPEQDEDEDDESSDEDEEVESSDEDEEDESWDDGEDEEDESGDEDEEDESSDEDEEDESSDEDEEDESWDDDEEDEEDESWDDDEEDEEDESWDDDEDEEDEEDESSDEDEEDESWDDDDDDDGGSSSSSSTRDAIVDYALSFVGNVPYVYGGTSLSSGVDCSGFVQQVFRHFGISLPRTSDSQGGSGYGVSSSNKQPGDIIYYGGHVGIYIGGGEVVHASNERSGIKVSSWNYRGVSSIRNVID